MPRDSGGTYTFPAGASRPVVAGTAIDATAQNTLEDDVKAALTDSLSRSGNGSMLAAFRHFDGTLANPSITFGSETSTGFYRSAANVFKAVVAGVARLAFTTTGVDVIGLLTSSAGIKSHTDAPAPSTAGDISASRAGGTTGLISLGPINRYIYYDGTNYNVNGAPLINGTVFRAACSVSAAGAILAQTAGSVTISGNGTAPPNAKVATGSYKFTVSGATANGIYIVTANGNNVVASAARTGTDEVQVATFVDTTGGAVDCAFSLMVVAL